MSDWSICNTSDISKSVINQLPDVYWKYTFGIVITIISFLATLENAFILLIFYKHPTLRTASNKILMSMTTADVLTGLIVGPLYASALLNEKFGSNCVLNLTRKYLAGVFMGASTLTVAFLAIDRTQHIRKLRHYKLTSKVLYGVLLLIWFLPIAVPLVAFLHNKAHATLLGVIGVGAVLIVIISYIVLLVILKKHGQQQSNEQLQNVSTTNEKKAAKTVVIIITCYLVMLIPLLIEKMLYATKYFEGLDKFERPKAATFAFFLCFCNSVVNPIIYVSRIPTFKGHVVRLFAVGGGREGRRNEQVRGTGSANTSI